MHFSKIYLQDNFVPNVVEDQFRRKVIGVEITVNEDESIYEANEKAEKYIKEYIQANIVYPDHNHVEIKNVPDIQIEKPDDMPLEYYIGNCTTLKELAEYKVVSSKSPQSKSIYLKKLKQLTNGL